jgi:hypothetical protein
VPRSPASANSVPELSDPSRENSIALTPSTRTRLRLWRAPHRGEGSGCLRLDRQNRRVYDANPRIRSACAKPPGSRSALPGNVIGGALVFRRPRERTFAPRDAHLNVRSLPAQYRGVYTASNPAALPPAALRSRSSRPISCAARLRQALGPGGLPTLPVACLLSITSAAPPAPMARASKPSFRSSFRPAAPPCAATPSVPPHDRGRAAPP